MTEEQQSFAKDLEWYQEVLPKIWSIEKFLKGAYKTFCNSELIRFLNICAITDHDDIIASLAQDGIHEKTFDLRQATISRTKKEHLQDFQELKNSLPETDLFAFNISWEDKEDTLDNAKKITTTIVSYSITLKIHPAHQKKEDK